MSSLSGKSSSICTAKPSFAAGFSVQMFSNKIFLHVPLHAFAAGHKTRHLRCYPSSLLDKGHPCFHKVQLVYLIIASSYDTAIWGCFTTGFKPIMKLNLLHMCCPSVEGNSFSSLSFVLTLDFLLLKYGLYSEWTSVSILTLLGFYPHQCL